MPENEANYSARSEDPLEELKVALGSITPLLGRISDTCKDQSKVYLTGLFSDQPWAKKSKRRPYYWQNMFFIMCIPSV